MAAASGRVDSIRQDVERSAFRAKNGIRYLAGIGRPKVGLSPKELIWTSGRHIHGDAETIQQLLGIVMSRVRESVGQPAR